MSQFMKTFILLARRCLLGWVPHSIYGIQNCLWSRKHIKNGVFRLSMYSKVSNKWHVCLYFYTRKCLGCAGWFFVVQYCAFIKFWSSENSVLQEKKIEISREKKFGKNFATFFSPCAFILSCAFIYLLSFYSILSTYYILKSSRKSRAFLCQKSVLAFDDAPIFPTFKLVGWPWKTSN